MTQNDPTEAKPVKPKKGKGGRKPADNPKRSFVNVRLTDDEYAKLSADANGGSKAELLRASYFGRKPKVPKAVPALNESAYSDLGRMGNNLNQLAKHANATGEIDPHIQDLLYDVKSQLVIVRALLLGRNPLDDET